MPKLSNLMLAIRDSGIAGSGGGMHRFGVPVRLRPSGFSLVELLLTIGVIAILAAIAVPNFVSYIPKARIGGAARETLTTIQLAKLAAIKENSNVVVHFAPGQCTAFVDDGSGGGTPNDRVRNGSERLVRQYQMPAGVSLSTPGFGADLEFNNRGLVTAGGDITLSASGKTKTIRIGSTGHAKIL